LQDADDMNQSTPATAAANAAEGAVSQPSEGIRWRWWGALGGLLTGFFDALTMEAFGVSFQANGLDMTWPVGAYFGLTFAFLGFLLGYTIEARRRERQSASLLQAQMEATNAARARLVQIEKLASLGQLAAAIAHEVRNPLGVIRSAAQGVAEGLPTGDDDSQRACSFIQHEIDRLNNVISALLAFARPPSLSQRSVAVGELFDAALLLAGDDLRDKQLRVRRDEAPGLLGVEVDPDLMSQVLLGLLANAAQASAAGSELTLEAARAGSSVEIAVADRGPGVPEEIRTRIFEPFFTTRTRGTGLGLAIARQIVEAHGGTIEVGDRAGGGARFAVRLPAARGTAVAA
jgi:two-component system sensor histidine kinase HydH